MATASIVLILNTTMILTNLTVLLINSSQTIKDTKR